jgi:hypothetical protein
MMYVHIPIEVASRKDLTITDKYVAGVILGLTKKNGFCHATNEHIAEQVGVIAKSISRIVSKLARLGVIQVEAKKSQDERGRWKTERIIRASSTSPLPTAGDTPSPQMGHINNKNKIKNTHTQERPIVNGFTKESLLEWWNKRYSKKFRSQAVSGETFDYWTSVYSEKEIKVAIGSHQKHPYWGDKLTPHLLFKRTDSKGADLDVIGQLLNFETDDPQVLRFRDALKEGNQ